MKRTALLAVVLVGLLAFVAYSASARTSRDLSRMVGYTIIAADCVKNVTQDEAYQKYVTLMSGTVFKVDGLYLDPLMLTDVIIFAKPYPPEVINQYRGSLPDLYMYSYKLLIDDNIYDATPR